MEWLLGGLAVSVGSPIGPIGAGAGLADSGQLALELVTFL